MLFRNPIRDVVRIVEENRMFDNYLDMFLDADGDATLASTSIATALDVDSYGPNIAQRHALGGAGNPLSAKRYSSCFCASSFFQSNACASVC